MRDKILKIAVNLGRVIGSLGIKLRSWIEFQEWKYLNLEQIKTIELPLDREVVIRYDRKGSFINVFFWQWMTHPDGKRGLQYLRETIKVSIPIQSSEVSVEQ